MSAALITGASSGIGAVFAQELAKRKKNLVLVARSEDKLQQIAEKLQAKYQSVYAATKAFVLNFTEALWAENRNTGVKILALCPGPTKTEFFNAAGWERFSVNNSEYKNYE
ncbi:MAG: SDR family NAD(P)-dependent oxidoreductase [Xenococcus sp. MO_188.B8]|nr:SDR family NAD(P)-dependent oxidoreductase [Xenococcus sp. MO_188.B8]